MDILKQFEGKINGTLETFDRIIINGYLQQLHSFRLFLYYLIQKNVLLKDFDSFATQQTDTLCNHIETYIQEHGCTLTYLSSGQTDKEGELIQVKEWVPMGKSIANLYRYVEISKAITKRYLAAMPDIDTDKVPEKEIMDVSAPKGKDGRRYSGFNLLSRETVKILSVIASGDFILNCFDNKSIRRRIYENSDTPKIINKTTRLLAKLKAHGIIKKVPRKNRYYLTSRGRDITNALLLFLNKELLNAA